MLLKIYTTDNQKLIHAMQWHNQERNNFFARNKFIFEAELSLIKFIVTTLYIFCAIKLDFDRTENHLAAQHF